MNKVKIMINGIPGNLASNLAGHFLSDERFQLIPYSLTGPEVKKESVTIGSFSIRLVSQKDRERMIDRILSEEKSFITIDYTHPSAVNENAEFYCRHNLPFIMGTTGGDRKLLESTVTASSNIAVIAPNMAKQIVGFQAMMAYAAENFPDLFKGYTLEIKESHQSGKADTSGTAKAMVNHFNSLGLDFSENEIQKIRDPEIQKNKWKIPEQYIEGHAWHTYTLTSADGTANFSFSHNINGRDIYSGGTFDAALFLHSRLNSAPGRVYTMMDVMKG